MESTDLAKWDDLHVTFYSGETQILQGGDGYVMKYSGTQDGYTYFTIPIPANASKFSINNGKNKSGSHNQSITAKSEILPLDPTGNEDLTQTFTKGGMLYTLSSNSLTKTAPTFTETATQQSSSNSKPYPSPRGDYIYIKDADGTNFNGTAPTFKFYSGANGETEITDTTPKVNTHENTSTPHWYSVGIPTNATKFSINGGSTKYDIYPRSSGSDGNYTPGGMYYDATGNDTLNATPLWPTFTETSATSYTDDNWSGSDARGDALYLVYETKPSGDVVVTFKDKNGSTISNSNQSGVSSLKANYIGQLASANPEVPGESTSVSEAVGYWFKVNIPKNAATFTATANSQSVTDEIYKLRQTPARYHKDYTLDGMQYHISGTTATRFYPVFTEDTVYTQQVGNQTLDTTSGVILVDESAVSDYIGVTLNPSAGTPEDNTTNVLHETSSNTITYTWQEGTGNPNYAYVRFKNTLNWSGTITAHFREGDISSTDVSYASVEGTGSNAVYKFLIPDTGNYKEVYFKNGSARTVSIKLAGNSIVGYGHGYMYYPATIVDNISNSHTTDGSGYYYVQIEEPDGANVTITFSSTVPALSTGTI